MIINLPLEQIFGANATQTLETITIKKSDLLVDSFSPESLLVALLLKVNLIYQGNISGITTEANQALTYDNQNFYLKLNNFYWRRHYLIVRDSPTIKDTFVFEVFTQDPDNYGQPINLNLL